MEAVIHLGHQLEALQKVVEHLIDQNERLRQENQWVREVVVNAQESRKAIQHATSFHSFTKLPREIRFTIWNYAADSFHRLGLEPLVVMQVCRESRTAVLWKRLPSVTEYATPEDEVMNDEELVNGSHYQNGG